MLFVDLYSIIETRCKVIESDPANNLKLQTVSLGMPLHGTEEMWKATSCSSTSQLPVSVIHHSVELLSVLLFICELGGLDAYQAEVICLVVNEE